MGDSIFSGKITPSQADKKQSNLVNSISEFNSKTRRHSKENNKQKVHTIKNENTLLEGRELDINTFKNGIF